MLNICIYVHVEDCSQNQLSAIRIERTIKTVTTRARREVRYKPSLSVEFTKIWAASVRLRSVLTLKLLYYVFSRVFCKAWLNYQQFSQQRRYVAFLAFDHLFGVLFGVLIWHDFCWTLGLKNPIPRPKTKLLRPQTSPVLTAPSEPFTLADVLTLSRSTCNFFRVRARGRSPKSWGYPHRCMVYFMENPENYRA